MKFGKFIHMAGRGGKRDRLVPCVHVAAHRAARCGADRHCRRYALDRGAAHLLPGQSPAHSVFAALCRAPARLAGQTAAIQKPATWYTNKLNSKKGQITKYAKWGLFLFVAIPLPGTGAWSGAAIAALLKMPPIRAFFSIAAGVVAAGLIMAVASSGVFSLFT